MDNCTRLVFCRNFNLRYSAAMGCRGKTAGAASLYCFSTFADFLTSAI